MLHAAAISPTNCLSSKILTSNNGWPMYVCVVGIRWPVLNLTRCAACSGAATICPAPCKWWLEQPPRAFSLEVTAHVGDAGHRTPSVRQVWSSYIFPFRRYSWFSVTALIGLVTLTFDAVNALSPTLWGRWHNKLNRAYGEPPTELASCMLM